MSCFAPIIGYYSSELNPSGRRGITFSPTAAFTGLPMKLPCGQCVGCRLEKSRQWAVRCMHENQMHETSSFITLTYDNDHLPENGSLVKRDLQLFMKRLRKRYGENSIRFYGCGEYGEESNRPHYHLLLFGIDFGFDRRLRQCNSDGSRYYDSASLREVWPAGNNIIGEVTFESAAYVARYVMKKVTGDLAEAHYQGREPEFCLMSRRPGIGARWVEQYGAQTYKLDAVVSRGREVRPPRYYDYRYKMVDEDRMNQIERDRRIALIGNREEQTLNRRRVRERCTYARLDLQGRKL